MMLKIIVAAAVVLGCAHSRAEVHGVARSDIRFCGSPPPESDRLDPRDTVHITVVRVGPQRWRADYVLPGGTNALRFSRARTTFSRESWEIVSPGLHLLASEATDMITATDGRPFEALTLHFASDPTKHEREYVLTPRFTDGSEGLFTGLLYVTPLRGVDTLEVATTLRFVPMQGERLVVRGAVHEGPTDWADAGGAGTYVYFGSLPATASPGVIGIVDPGLPEHLRAMFDDGLPRLFEYFGRNVGYPLEERPLVIIGYDPVDRPGLSSSGDVLPGVLRFGFEGTGWANDDSNVRRRAFYLLAHEAAHLWNGHRFNSAENRQAPWMHEGGAEAFAWLAMRDAGILTEESLRGELESALNECVFVARGRPLGETMSSSRAPYACGGVINMMVEAELREHGGLFAFWRALFAAAEETGDRYASRQFFSTLQQLTGDDLLSAFLQRLLTEALPDQPRTLAAELARIGVTVELGGLPAQPEVAPLLARRAMSALMQSDCGGRFSFSVERDGFRVNGMEACRVLPAASIMVTAFAGHSLASDPAAAYGAAAARCAMREAIPVTVVGLDTPLLLECPEPLPPYLRIEKWPMDRAQSTRAPERS